MKALCLNCKQWVELRKRFRILPFILLGFFLYILIYALGRPKYCPHCKTKRKDRVIDEGTVEAIKKFT